MEKASRGECPDRLPKACAFSAASSASGTRRGTRFPRVRRDTSPLSTAQDRSSRGGRDVKDPQAAPRDIHAPAATTGERACRSRRALARGADDRSQRRASGAAVMPPGIDRHGDSSPSRSRPSGRRARISCAASALQTSRPARACDRGPRAEARWHSTGGSGLPAHRAAGTAWCRPCPAAAGVAHPD